MVLAAILASYGIQTEAVEIDAAVLDAARRWFDYDQSAAVGDGRRHLELSQRQYDYIVIDAFAGAELPYNLVTQECFALAIEWLDE